MVKSHLVLNDYSQNNLKNCTGFSEKGLINGAKICIAMPAKMCS